MLNNQVERSQSTKKERNDLTEYQLDYKECAVSDLFAYLSGIYNLKPVFHLGEQDLRLLFIHNTEERK